MVSGFLMALGNLRRRQSKVLPRTPLMASGALPIMSLYVDVIVTHTHTHVRVYVMCTFHRSDF